DVGAALEHDVLEQVGEAGLALDLVLAAHAVPDVDRHHGREVILGDDQAQAIGQALIGEGDPGSGWGHDPDCRPGATEAVGPWADGPGGGVRTGRCPPGGRASGWSDRPR